MSLDTSGPAVGRLQTDLPDAGASPGDLADIAAALERVAALLKTDPSQGAGESEALDRIADIAFVLHEREVEPSLCDALDAAVRALGEAAALKQESARQAAALLRALARRVDSLVALKQAQRSEPCDDAMSARSPESASARGNEIGLGADHTIPRVTPLATEVEDDNAFAQAVARLIGTAADATASSVPAREPQTLADPDDDPGDLFEPRAHGAANPPNAPGRSVLPPPAQKDARPMSAPASASAASMTVGAAAQPTPLPRGNDPLAALRALSEEEMIALFS